ncbi:hypothetical protein P9112_012959 [Eukaryota sp. TZLM1-RC]
MISSNPFDMFHALDNGVETPSMDVESQQNNTSIRKSRAFQSQLWVLSDSDSDSEASETQSDAESIHEDISTVIHSDIPTITSAKKVFSKEELMSLKETSPPDRELYDKFSTMVKAHNSSIEEKRRASNSKNSGNKSPNKRRGSFVKGSNRSNSSQNKRSGGGSWRSA